MFCFGTFVVVAVKASLIFMRLLMLNKHGTFVYFLKQGSGLQSAGISLPHYISNFSVHTNPLGI